MTKGKSERFKIREMELEYQLAMQREKLIADAFLHPPGIYLLGLGGSALIAYMTAALTPVEKRTESDLAILAKGLISIISPVGGVYALVGEQVYNSLKDTSASPLSGLILMAAGGGAGMFITLLVLNEMKPDGSGDGGGILGTLLSAVAL